MTVSARASETVRQEMKVIRRFRKKAIVNP
jgi:hypothetical protein